MMMVFSLMVGASCNLSCMRGLPFVVLMACSPSTPKLGAFTLGGDGKVFSVTANGKELLRGFRGVQPSAQAAVRSSRARTEMQYGSWKFTEGNQAWQEAQGFAWDSVSATSGVGSFRDASNAVVVEVQATTTEGALRLDYAAKDPSVNRLSLSFACSETDRFVGFGAQADGVDHRGHTIAVWTSEPGIGKRMIDDAYPEAWMLEGTRHASSYGLPTFLSNRGFIAVADTSARSVFELCSVESAAWRVEAWSNRLTLWIYFDTTPAKALTRATQGVLGRPIKPPPVAFAPWNDAIFGSAEVRRVAKTLRDNDIPSSVIWTEDFRGGREVGPSYRLKEEWELDRALYPDAEALARELASQGLDWHAYFNTFLVDGEQIFSEAVAGDHFVKNDKGAAYSFEGPTFRPTGLADLSRPQTREWIKSYQRKALDLGFKGWMADFAEWLPHDAVLFSSEPALEAHNRYPMEWAKLNAEVLKERDPQGDRLVFFARAGYLGANAFAPVVWAGDQRTSFQRDDGLVTVIPMGIGLGLAGVSTYGHDIAGYQSGTNPVATKELFFRWTSLGALTPVMRTHHGTAPRTNWSFDKDTESLAHFRRWAKTHVQLFPFFDGLAREAEATGLPIIRGLFLESPDDATAWVTSDEYLLGRSILVAPIVEEGATRRAVHVPPGDWVPLTPGAAIAGPADVMASAAPTELPLWFRLGAVIPRLPDRVDTLVPADPPTVDLEDVKRERSLWWAPGGVDTFVERDGTTYTSGASAEQALAENGALLPACASPTQRGCVDRSGPRWVARLSAQGPLTGLGGTLVLTGPARTIDVELVTAQ
jgi:alpha-glucosidase (family GH31 glycosyl hydrolase)